jgi:1-acyl-sn-glycerol-3-phosphate acyltransferase
MLANKIRGYIRLTLVFIASFIAFLTVTILRVIPVDRYKWGLRIRKIWSSTCIWILNFKVEVRGSFPRDRNYLFVGNHRSSLDPFVGLTYLEANPVSRGDVRKYPFIGKGAELTGIIFVNKASKASKHGAKQSIYDALKAGKSIMIYPEGKTGSQPLTATFQKGSFEMAAELGIPVIPFIIEYKSLNDNWDHTDTMAQHYFKNLAKHRTDVRLSVGEVIASDNAWTLLRQSQQWMNDEIVRLRADWGGLSKGHETRDVNSH